MTEEGIAMIIDPEPDNNAPVSRQRVVDMSVFEYRSMVLRRLDVTAEWRGIDWTDDAACADQTTATPEVCGRCAAVAECLAAAVVSDDRAAWRGGLSRADRERLWAGLERTYRDVRDFELMRTDVRRLPRTGAARAASRVGRNGRRP